jgi:hypothetical protein
VPERKTGVRSLMVPYAMCAAGALVAAIVCAWAGDWWEHNTPNQALLLLPISNVRFWFIPFLAASCAGVALAARRRSRYLVVGTAILVLACIGSTWYWLDVGRRLGPRWTSSDLEAVMAERNLGQLIGGGASLTGIIVFLAGVAQSMGAPRRS